MVEQVWKSISRSFSKYALNTYYVPGTILDTGDSAMNQTDKCWQHVQTLGKIVCEVWLPNPPIFQPIAKACKVKIKSRSFDFKGNDQVRPELLGNRGSGERIELVLRVRIPQVRKF